MVAALAPLIAAAFVLSSSGEAAMRPAAWLAAELNSEAARSTPLQTADGLADELLAEFDKLLVDPAQYARRAKAECSGFPEGDLFPYVFPSLAYAGLVSAGRVQPDEAAKKVNALVDLAIESVVHKVRPPNGSLYELRSYARHATYLCQLNMALAAEEWIRDSSWAEGGRQGMGEVLRCAQDDGGVDRCQGMGEVIRCAQDDGGKHGKLLRHLSWLIRKGLEESGGAPLASFPSYSWPFDTIPCLASIAIHDRLRGKTGTEAGTEALLSAHFEWIEKLAGTEAGTDALLSAHFEWIEKLGTEPRTGLPYSVVSKSADGPGTGLPYAEESKSADGAERYLVRPRGCDLSLRIMYLGLFDRDRAKTLYTRYVEHFWLERFVAAGFAEWPGGGAGFVDADSGPVLLGIGSAASAMGIGAAVVAGDEYRRARLLAQVGSVREGIRNLLCATAEPAGTPASSGCQTDRPRVSKTPLLGNMIPIREGYVSGFLFGDAVLFWAIAWHPWESRAGRGM